MDTVMPIAGPRLIERGFPCHQVGAETQRELDTGQAPPTHRLHVWWARRPLTASRAAILASLSPPDLSADDFLRQLGIEQRVVDIGGETWVLTEDLIGRIHRNEDGSGGLAGRRRRASTFREGAAAPRTGSDTCR